MPRQRSVRRAQRLHRVWEEARWRGRWVKREVETARAFDQAVPYLIRALRRRHVTAAYTVRGRPLQFVHGSHDAWVFHEVFVDGYYDLTSGFPPPSRIADLGGNVGMFALFAAIHWPGAEIIAFEPDPANATRYRWTMEHNEVAGRLVEACAAARDGSVSFLTGAESHGRITADGSGRTVPAADVFPHLQTVDLIKMDIEGGEWELLLDARFADLPARTVLLEYHPYLCPQRDARTAAWSALAAAGYAAEPIFHDDRNGVGMLRAFRQEAPSAP